MKNKLTKFLFWPMGALVGIGSLVIVVGMIASFLFLFSQPSPSLSDLSDQNDVAHPRDPEPADSLRGKGAFMEFPTLAERSEDPEPEQSHPVSGKDLSKTPGDPITTEELDHAFEAFMAERGVSPQEVHRELAALPTAIKQVADPSPDPILTLSPEATQTLKEEYPVAEARRQPNGEVWIRIDGREADNLTVDELMARAAELYDDTGEPMKMVVWEGNRPKAVRTFNGHPIF